MADGTPTGTPTLDQFLAELQRIICEQNGAQLQDYLVIEPPYRQLYTAMIAEIRQRYPKGKEDELEGKCSAALPEAREGADGSPWTAFIKFITQYFAFIRDVNVENLLETYNQLSELVQKCNSALGHPSLGIVILPTVIAYSRVLARLAIGLDKRPELIAHLTKQSSDDSGVRETLPERAANILRQAFVTCLNDRTGTASGVRDGKPDGKKVGIYTIANLCLKILFQCRKTRNAEQIFSNIYNQSPPLSIYPRPERITYLYYLGRFLFSNNHFYRAQHALQAAYDQCPPHRLKQRRLILIYLVASNIILGRFPSAALYSQPEALGFAERFAPLCRSIARGDLATFRRLTDPKNEHASWFLHYRIFLQLKNRCEVLVWRSLIRKTFVLAGQQGDAQARKAPTLDLGYVLQLAQMLEQKALSPLSQLDGGPGRRHTNWIFMDREPPASARYVDPDFAGTEEGRPEVLLPDMLEVESIVASLVDQGLLNGFISHRQLRFAIQGAKRKGALPAGFPNVWEVVKGRCDEEVPGWKKDPPRGAVGATAGRIAAGGFGPGMVVNLSGARPVGAVP
ncbi:hypothetical protein W97_04720 [Coniosporium apollinis CBS 100218]|uniref:PCI domain-containing protein n=1 Tax=Coniosporium apollinis (strain CBS 100218) TaxID=1168221 RepID=R7YU98_CONA1|nr:uncharacterized protein W97_04720 [Coniosporium apollinis CBS 100218]EON65482.1 hypothetical protein W97_04720 [Coniosporium apollinis CBS 100218]